jgi:hypothetical protein
LILWDPIPGRNLEYLNKNLTISTSKNLPLTEVQRVERANEKAAVQKLRRYISALASLYKREVKII